MATNSNTTLADLLGVSLKKLTADFRQKFDVSGGKALTRAKYLIAFERHPERDAKQSLRKFMEENFDGVLDSNALKPAVVFRNLVATDAAPGKISEEQFDAVTVITAHIAASAIINTIEKRRESKEDGAAMDAFTEDLARIFRDHDAKDNAATLKKLEVLKVTVKPAASDKETPEQKAEREAKEAEEAEEKKRNEAVPLTALGLLDLFSGEQGKATWRTIMEHAKGNPAEALIIAEKIQALAANAAKVAPVVLTFQPAPVEKAA